MTSLNSLPSEFNQLNSPLQTIAHQFNHYPTNNMTGNTNPGNFANRPKEEVQEIASKGGQASHSGGFASMDADKQREIASQGGKASSGSFEPGSEKAREAGRKGGQSS
ncbi:Conidiation-specific 10 protein [Paramyrothecium foliicola]|nr:Conidiation-specific 10 protein [Paramyrothecium foliicola]